MFVLVTACKYPFSPDHDIQSSLPVFGNESDNMTEEMKETINLNISFYNRNRLMRSVTYDDLNITMSYLASSESYYVAMNIEPGFSQHQPSPKEINVQMRAPGLPGLFQLQKELGKPIYFRVKLEITAGFRCESLCKNTHRFHNLVWDFYISGNKTYK